MITACITSFMRPQCLERLITSIKRHHPDLCIRTQDTGGNLSWGRNQLVRDASTEFCLILEDDFELIDSVSLENMLAVLRHDDGIGLIAGRLYQHGILTNYAYDLDVTNEKLIATSPPRAAWHDTPGLIAYQPVEMTWNYFLARRDFLLRNPWDEKLELHEHGAWFLSLKANELHQQVAWTPAARAYHHHDRSDPKYVAMRTRTPKFKPHLLKYYGFNEVQYVRNIETLPGKRFANPNRRRMARQAAIDFAIHFPGAFPVCGTLLGMMREGDLITHDSDVDFACLDLPTEEHTVGPFQRSCVYHDNGRACEYVWRHVNNTKVDLFHLEPADGQRVLAIYPDEFPDRKTYRLKYPDHLFEKMMTLRRWGHDFTVPESFEEMLEVNYGFGWREPDPTFDYYTR